MRDLFATLLFGATTLLLAILWLALALIGAALGGFTAMALQGTSVALAIVVGTAISTAWLLLLIRWTA